MSPQSPDRTPTNPIRYACGMFGTSIPINMFRTFAAAFYVDKLGLPTDQLALILFLYTFLDAVDNIIYGYLSDRTRTKWGRRRPWLVIGTPLLVLGFVLFYNPPAFVIGSENSLFVYVLLLYALTGTLDSLINANYGALFPDLFRTDATRATTNTYRQAFQLLAMMISVALTPMVAGSLGYGVTAILYGLLGGAVILYCAFGCHEDPDSQVLEKPALLPSILALARNKRFWIWGISNAFYSAAMSLVMVAMNFFSKYTLGIGSGQTTLLFATVLLVSIAAVGVWAIFLRRRGLMSIWRLALMVLAIAFVPLYFANTFATAILAAALVGIGFAGAIATFDLVGARIIDDDAAQSGLRREGIFSSMGGFLNRLNGAFTALAFLLVNRWYGFVSGDQPGAMPDQAARFLLVLFPFVMMVCSCVTSRLLRLPDKEQ